MIDGKEVQKVHSPAEPDGQTTELSRLLFSLFVGLQQSESNELVDNGQSLSSYLVY